MTKKVLLPDTNQNFWQLTCIQVMTYGLTGLLTGALVAKNNGIGTACVSIVIGNLVLWVIGLSIVLMSHHGRNNAIQNIRNYFGFSGAILANLVLGAAFLTWYPINIEYAVLALNSVVPNYFPLFKGMGIALGVLVAVLSSGGIVLVRKICEISFFVFVFLLLISFFIFKSNFYFGEFGFSFLGTLYIVLPVISGIINLPTFFRHSRSKEDSVLALTLMTVFVSVFQFFGIISGVFSQFNGLDKMVEPSAICILFSALFIFITSVCVNLGNIYFSSAILEFFIPTAKKSVGYMFI